MARRETALRKNHAPQALVAPLRLHGIRTKVEGNERLARDMPPSGVRRPEDFLHLVAVHAFLDLSEWARRRNGRRLTRCGRVVGAGGHGCAGTERKKHRGEEELRSESSAHRLSSSVITGSILPIDSGPATPERSTLA